MSALLRNRKAPKQPTKEHSSSEERDKERSDTTRIGEADQSPTTIEECILASHKINDSSPATRRLKHEVAAAQQSWQLSNVTFGFLLLIITLVAIVTRFQGIEYPNETVHDEVHFAHFVKYYVTRTYFFDIHPPLGKLLHYQLCYWLTGKYFNPDDSVFERIGNKYIPEDGLYAVVRVVSALFGVMLVPLTFLIVKELKRSLPSALLATALVLFEGQIFTTSRLILVDGILWFFLALTTYACLRLWNTEDEEIAPSPPSLVTSHPIVTGIFGTSSASYASLLSEQVTAGQAVQHESSRSSTGWTPLRLVKWLLYSAIAGGALGATFATKWMSIGAVLTILFTAGWRVICPWLFLLKCYLNSSSSLKKKKNNDGRQLGKANDSEWQLQLTRAKIRLASVSIFIVSMCVIYYGAWIWHLSILSNSGPGDVWHSPAFKATLNGTIPDESAAPVEPLTLWQKFWEVNWRLLDANRQSQSPHDWGSPWYTWPLMHRPVFYWDSRDITRENTNTRDEIWLLGNPATYILTDLTTVLYAMFLLYVANSDRCLTPREVYWSHSGLWIFIAAIASWAMYFWVGANRVTFFYNYVISLYYGILLSPFVLEKYVPYSYLKWLVVPACILLSAAGWAYNYHYYTGSPLSSIWQF